MNNTTGLWEPALLKRLKRKRLFKRLINKQIGKTI
jgi:hypothetical protein